MTSRSLALMCAISLNVAVPIAPAAPIFYALPPLSGSAVNPAGLSPDGSVLVGRSNSSQPLSWSASQGTLLLPSLTTSTALGEAVAASNAGTYIAGFQTNVPSTFNQAVLWGPSGPLNLGDLDTSGIASNKFSRAHGISADGSVVVGETNSPQGRQAFRWTAAGGMVGLGKFSGDLASKAYDVSNDGQVIVGGSFAGGLVETGFRWTAATGLQPIPDLPGGIAHSVALAVSGDGSTIVGRSMSAASDASGGSNFEAYRWTAEQGTVALGDLPGGGFYSIAEAVSGDGSSVVGWSFTENGPRAFIWDTLNGMRNLQDVLADEYGLSLPGWTLSSAAAISDDGNVIAGRGSGPGAAAGWVVVIPEPTGGSLLALACGSRLLRRRPRRCCHRCHR